MKEYLKITGQDELILFKELRISDMMLTPTTDGQFRFDLDIKTFNGQYPESEINEIEKDTGHNINRDISYVWLTIENKPLNQQQASSVKNIDFEIKKGWDEENGEGLASAYFGWGIELFNNKISIREVENEIWLNWTANSDDVNYYDERAKPTMYEFNVKVNLIELSKESDIHARWKRLANESDVYFKVLRDMNNGPLYENQKRIFSPLNRKRNYYDAITAWKAVPGLLLEHNFEPKY